ncbi:MAG: hypothetical protein V4521_00840, partial [Pseudomonadota bacterium]
MPRLVFLGRLEDVAGMGELAVAPGPVEQILAQLDPALASGGSPLFNRAIIAGWKRPMGIEVHWTVDGPLNLL